MTATEELRRSFTSFPVTCREVLGAYRLSNEFQGVSERFHEASHAYRSASGLFQGVSERFQELHRLSDDFQGGLTVVTRRFCRLSIRKLLASFRVGFRGFLAIFWGFLEVYRGIIGFQMSFKGFRREIMR